MDQVRLNLGGALNPQSGYTNLDIKDGHDARDLSAYADGTVDEIRASHVLEHISFRETDAVLREWVRALKPGGRLRIAVPDALLCMRAIVGTVDGDAGADIEFLSMALIGGNTDEHDSHKAMFDRRGLQVQMQRAGLIAIQEWKGEGDCSALPVSLNLEGTKPVEFEPSEGRVHCLMSVPRLGWTANFSCVTNACVSLKIPLHTATGAYYGNVMQETMRAIIGEGPDALPTKVPDYLVTVDYDSVFEPDDLRKLLTLMDANKDIAGLAALQTKRGDGKLLLNTEKGGVYANELDAEVTDVETAHFGLTVLRVSDLKDTPLPWFAGRVAEDGTFRGKGATDPDVAFWKNWREHGKRVCIASRTPIGHMEEVIAWPSEELRPIYQQMKDYRANGRPKGVHE
jgi:hypothetical protein